MLPVSGAEQLNTSGPNPGERPITSHNGAYSRFVRPAPRSLCGRNRFHSPSARALIFSSSTIGATCQRSRSICSWNSDSFG